MPRYRQYDDDATSPYEAEPVDAEEEAYKRAGLAASNEAMRNAPKQGILESLGRLFEGNLDQPGSVAYNKYGAGLGRALANNPNYSNEGRGRTQAPAPVARTPVDRAPVDMNAGVGRRDAGRGVNMNAGVDRRDAGRGVDINAGMGRRNAGDSEITPNAMGVPDTEVYKRSERDDFKGMRMPTRPGQKTSGVVTSAAPIVTKEELAASGMNLRDYLNAKTRGKSTPPPGSSNAPSRVLMPNTQGQPGGSVPTKRPRGQGTVMEQGRGVNLYGDSLESLLKKDPNKKSFFKANDERIANLKKGGAVKKMSTGGSASRRGDGIAQRGKTKGKLC